MAFHHAQVQFGLDYKSIDYESSCWWGEVDGG
jgi:hypothetical protein